MRCAARSGFHDNTSSEHQQVTGVSPIGHNTSTLMRCAARDGFHGNTSSEHQQRRWQVYHWHTLTGHGLQFEWEKEFVATNLSLEKKFQPFWWDVLRAKALFPFTQETAEKTLLQYYQDVLFSCAFSQDYSVAYQAAEVLWELGQALLLEIEQWKNLAKPEGYKCVYWEQSSGTIYAYITSSHMQTLPPLPHTNIPTYLHPL